MRRSGRIELLQSSDFFVQDFGEVPNERQQYPQAVIQGPDQEACYNNDDETEEVHMKSLLRRC